MKKYSLLFLLILLVFISSCTTIQNHAEADEPIVFTYVHDPRLDPRAMEDIKEDPTAIYGFSPREDSQRIGAFASFDWSDPAIVEPAREERIAYNAEVKDLFILLAELREKGYDTETCARTISELRNKLRLDAYKNNPDGLEAAKKSNLKKYGNEYGPTPESLYEKYGSWQTVLEKAFSCNHGMDACLGLYDDQYDNYVLLGEI